VKRLMVVLAIVVGGCALGYGILVAVGPRSAEQNYQQAQKAFNDRQPSECQQIRGDSYTLASDGSKVKISQKTARSLCVDSINHGSTNNFLYHN